MKNNCIYNDYNNSIGFCGALQLIFIVLKLMKIINWSWWFVLLPTIAPTVIAVLLFAVALMKVAGDNDDDY